MPSLEELLAATLLGRKQELQAQNPYTIAAKAISGLDFTPDTSGLKFITPEDAPISKLKGIDGYQIKNPYKDSWKRMLLQGLAQGYTQSLGESQAQNEYSNLATKLSKAYESPNVIAALQGDRDLGQFAGLASLIKNQRNAELDQYKEKLKLENPFLFGATPQGASPANMESMVEGVTGGGTGDQFTDEFIKARRLGAPAGQAITYATKKAGIGQRNYPSQTPLSPTQKDFYGQQLGIPEEQREERLSTMGALEKELDLQKFQGERKRPIGEAETKYLSSNDFFQYRVKRLEELADKMSDDPGVIKAAKGGKILPWFGKTDSPEYKYYAELTAAQQEYARSKDSGALSTFDVKIWEPLFTGLPIFDDKQTIKQRLKDLSTSIKEARKIQLTSMKKGGVNLFDFEKELVDDNLLNAVKKVESAGDANALSSAGAEGAYQIMPDTAKDILADLGLDTTSYDPRNEIQQRQMAAHYLGTMIPEMLKAKGIPITLENILAAYNAGAGAVSQSVANNIPLPQETKAYVPKVLSTAERARVEMFKKQLRAQSGNR